uniref:Uncharacterized protein n=1 Tax=Aegilops tauschii subsp. strangulata TaxID=200361 RepID=A0A453IA65_AEGTS
MASPEPSAAAAAAAGAGGDAAGQRAPVEPLRLPTPEEIKGQEMMNNCAVRSVLSGVMGNASLLTTSNSNLLILLYYSFSYRVLGEIHVC